MCSRAVAATAACCLLLTDAAGAQFFFLVWFVPPRIFFCVPLTSRLSQYKKRNLITAAFFSFFWVVWFAVVAPKSQFDPNVENAREWNKTQWTSECNSVKLNRYGVSVCVLGMSGFWVYWRGEGGGGGVDECVRRRRLLRFKRYGNIKSKLRLLFDAIVCSRRRFTLNRNETWNTFK